MMEIVMLVIIFACVFAVSMFALPRKSEMIVRERLEPLSGRNKKKGVFVQFLSVLAPVNKLIRLGRLHRKIADNLRAAGSPMDVYEYLTLKELLMLFLPLITFVFIGSGGPRNWLLMAGGIGFILPSLWISHLKYQRQKAIARALPEIIDLLNLAVGAGLDFMVALGKILERVPPGPLVDELTEVYHETQVGKTKAEALKSLAQRVNLPDVSSFVRTLVQAEKMGTSISDVLRIQAEQTRMWRFQRGERQALKAPIKLLFPLVFFILPVVLIVVGGPIMLRFFESGTLFR